MTREPIPLCHRCLGPIEHNQRWRVSDAGYKVHAHEDECDVLKRPERDRRLNKGGVYSRRVPDER